MKKKLLCLLLALPAVTGYSTNLTLNPATISYQNPTDAVSDFNLLTGGWNATDSQRPFCQNSTPIFNRAVISSHNLSSGYTTTISGSTYTIFTSNMPGIGWIMGARDPNAPLWTPLTNSDTQVYPFVGGGTNNTVTLGAYVQFAFVKLPGNLPVGANMFPSQKIATFSCYQNEVLMQSADILVNTTQINVQALACQVTTAKNVAIPLGEFSLEQLPPVNGNFGEFSSTVELSCDSGLTPWMTISDASNTGNTSNVIKLSPDSTASGVGVQVFYNNQTVAKSLGLDTSSKGNPNQFQVNNKTTSNGQHVSVPLQFKYIRTEQVVTPGDANAAATVTFSYQ
ncbi:fimbrial protein [Serratia fonticola]|uniref:fimbrial protein n=1 Tax=Serratia fonticola TaxID=47917 RepID=UPI003BB4C3CB